MSNTCGSLSGLEDQYNLALHIGAVFIILFVSGSACAFPLFVVKIPQLRIPSTFLFFVRHFGTGVLLATAFVHLLPTAFTSLTDPCLPAFWNERYPAMAGAIAMAGVFVIVLIEMVFSPGRSMCEFPAGQGGDDVEGGTGDGIAPGRECDRSGSMDHIAKVATSKQKGCQCQTEKTVDEHSATPPPSLSPSQKLNRETLQCILLEMGILFHSVFIGMALSVAVGNDFVVLLIAITFHQTFEGLALGSRIANIAPSFRPSSPKPWLMALAYGCTTPIGQALGLALHTAYDPQSATGLIVVGVMNAISAGLLTYASLVELMAEDFLSAESWQVLRGRRRVLACALVGGGAVCMAVVGGWA